MFLEILQNLQESTSIRVSFLIKLQASVCNFMKKGTLALLFSCEFFEISRNTFFHRTPLGDCFWFEIWQITCYLKDLRTLLKTLQFVYYSNRTPYLELHSPTKSLLPDVPHKYKKALCSISILKFFNVFISSTYLQIKFDN